MVGRLVSELGAKGATSLPVPSCALCQRQGLPLTRSSARGGVAPVADAVSSPKNAPAAGSSNPSPAATMNTARSAPAARTVHNGPADGADGPVGSPAAPTATGPTSATAVSSCPRPSARAAGAAGRAVSPARTHRSAPAAHRAAPPSAPAAARTSPPPRTGRRDQSATPATRRRCATAAAVTPVTPNVDWSTHPGLTPRPAPTAPGCQRPTSAATAARRTSSTNAVGANAARYTGAPASCSAPAVSRSPTR